jgi:hypothetical protein
MVMPNIINKILIIVELEIESKNYLKDTDYALILEGGTDRL